MFFGLYNRKLHGGLKIVTFLQALKKTIFYSLAALAHKILFLTLENNIHNYLHAAMQYPLCTRLMLTNFCDREIFNALDGQQLQVLKCNLFLRY